MKTLLLSIAAVSFLLPFQAQAVTVQASWDAVTKDIEGGNENISHYVLYYGTTQRAGGVTHPDQWKYASNANVGNVTQYDLSGLTAGRTYYFAVVAVDIGGNVSNYSTEFTLVIPPEDDGGGTDAGDETSLPDSGPDSTPTDPGADSAQPPSDLGGDNSVPPGHITGGCGCSASGSLGGFGLYLFLVMILFRRRTE